ncbi:hypothetical protein BFW01_g11497 [Lasiodiplodia theobromae]|nr:hypothetical protein BFW01_g11497 [Lasiodiplodia theobromae]
MRRARTDTDDVATAGAANSPNTGGSDADDVATAGAVNASDTGGSDAANAASASSQQRKRQPKPSKPPTLPPIPPTDEELWISEHPVVGLQNGTLCILKWQFKDFSVLECSFGCGECVASSSAPEDWLDKN